MTLQSNSIDDFHSKISSKLTPKCMVVVVITGIIFCGIYSSVRSPMYSSVRHIPESSGYQCDFERNQVGALKLIKYSDIDHQRLFYNRVPKCGSTTMLTLMQKLSIRLGYKHVNSKVYDKKMATEEEQSRIVNWIVKTPPPCSFDRHVYFINFTRFGKRPPLYMNMVRDPVEKIISSFFYRRMAVATNRTIIKVKPSATWLNKKFERCVMSSDPECTFIDGSNHSYRTLPFFCGQEHQCWLQNDPYALQKAKQNIIDSYAVVGVLEHMNITLRVLEAVLPEFFKGALKLYHSLGVHRNKNPKKQNVSEEVKLLLKANLTAEYELYNFVVQRLYDQHRHVVLS